MTAPALENLFNPSLPTILENAANPAGITVANLVVDGSITDADGVVEAIAITALNASVGTWQYSVNGGASWLTIRAELINSSTNELALLLGPTAQVRLLPFGELNGTLADAITFRAWDQSSGSQGQYVVISATGGSSAFSAASDTASLTVTAIDDAPTFAPINGSGKLIMPVGSSHDYGQSVTVQPDGKIVMAGYSYNGSNYDYSLIRLNADGSLDSTFNGTGKLIVPVGIVDYGTSVTIQPDGKIVVAGVSYNGSTDDYSLVRLNADGSLDTTFNGTGKLILPVGSSADHGYSVILQPDGKIVVAGFSYNGSNAEYSLVRLNADGNLDTTFNGTGKLILPVGSYNDHGYSAILQPDGKIVVAGYSSDGISYDDHSLIRLNADGSLDTTFNGTGKLILPVSIFRDDHGFSVTIQPDGKIVVAGTSTSYNASGSDYNLTRLNADGSRDTTFNGTGMIVLPVGGGDDQGRSVTLQPDGKIVVAGYSYNGANADYSLVRLNANGSLDTTFNGTGKLIVPVGSGSDQGQSVTVQPDGKIVVAGYSSNGSNADYSLIRLHADGSLDTNFNGSAAETLGGTAGYTENAASVALDSSVIIYDAELAGLAGGAGNYGGASVTLERHAGASSQDIFSAQGNLSLTGGNAALSSVTVGTYSNAGGTLTITFNANATQARVNEVLSSIGYANSSDAPPASVQIDWRFSDGNAGTQGSGGALTATGSTTMSIAAVNDAPVNTVPGAQTVSQGNNLTVSGISVADVDASTLQVTLQAAHGVLTLSATSGLTFSGSADGSADASLSFSGAKADVNAALNDLVYRGYSGYRGADTITLTTTDLGASGTGGTLTDTDTVAVTVTVTGGLALSGTSNADTLAGAEGNDMLSGLGSADLLQGIAGDDCLLGGGGNDTLDGGSGADYMAGGLANDSYVIDAASDLVAENPAEGTDTVTSLINYTLSANVENLLLLGTALTGTGNELNNVLTGNSVANALDGGLGNDTLNGAGGADSMAGGAGSDTYVRDNAGDVINELAGEGFDTVQSSVNTTLGANVEKLILTGLARNGTGNVLNNNLVGNDGDNVLAGSDGNDTLDGAAGNDTLQGGVGADNLMGGDGNDRLDGLGGADTMAGGAGDDLYIMDIMSDVVIEAAGSGTDTVQSRVNGVLSANVESLVLTGAGNTLGTGNDLGNLITGNAGANKLSGLAGNDALFGGLGNDSLFGGEGDDILDGGLGNDQLLGGAGADSFVFAAGSGVDRITDFSVAQGDKIQLQAGLNGSAIVDGASALAGASQVDGDVMIDLGAGNSVTLVGMALAGMAPTDFVVV